MHDYYIDKTRCTSYSHLMETMNMKTIIRWLLDGVSYQLIMTPDVEII